MDSMSFIVSFFRDTKPYQIQLIYLEDSLWPSYSLNIED